MTVNWYDVFTLSIEMVKLSVDFEISLTPSALSDSLNKPISKPVLLLA